MAANSNPPADDRQPSVTSDKIDLAKADQRQFSNCPIADLRPDPRNPRKHSRAQIRAIAKSIDAFGFNAPILVDRKRRIIAGHGRYEAAKFLNLAHVPVVFLDHLSEEQARAYMLADNKLTDRSTWDDLELATQLKELSDLTLDFDIEATGFEAPEIDLRIQSLDELNSADVADEFEFTTEPAVSAVGDIWHLGDHRIYCGNALNEGSGMVRDCGKRLRPDAATIKTHGRD